MVSEETPQLPPIDSLPASEVNSRTLVLSLLLEPSTCLLSRYVPILSSRPFTSYNELIDFVQSDLTQLSKSIDEQDIAELDDILSSHPRLGEKKVDSALSRMEQKAMENASKTTEADDSQKLQEAETLKNLNNEYEATFPSLKFVTWVNGRPRTEIFKEMQSRIARNDIDQERLESINVSWFVHTIIRSLIILVHV
jgi:2-oxo-4-hydroxy-4-carboxy--5-ureidoimidazoline (OHCU) decarboxylase